MFYFWKWVWFFSSQGCCVSASFALGHRGARPITAWCHCNQPSSRSAELRGSQQGRDARVSDHTCIKHNVENMDKVKPQNHHLNMKAVFSAWTHEVYLQSSFGSHFTSISYEKNYHHDMYTNRCSKVFMATCQNKKKLWQKYITTVQ